MPAPQSTLRLPPSIARSSKKMRPPKAPVHLPRSSSLSDTSATTSTTTSTEDAAAPLRKPKLVCIRRVRVICTDPEATESSSDEEEFDEEQERQRRNSRCRPRPKRVVREISMPADCCYLRSALDDDDDRDEEASSYYSHMPSHDLQQGLWNAMPKKTSKKWRCDTGYMEREFKPQLRPPPSRKANAASHSVGKGCGYIGVRQRRMGKWAAELRDPARGIRQWLGTYPSAEEAAMAYDNAARKVKGCQAVTNFDRNHNNSEREYVDTEVGEGSSAPAVMATYTRRKYLSGYSQEVKAPSLQDNVWECSSFGDVYVKDAWSRCGALDDNSDLLQFCPEFDSMEECLLGASPSSVLDKPDSCLFVTSPSSVLENAISEECGSADKGSFDSQSDESGTETSSPLQNMAVESSFANLISTSDTHQSCDVKLSSADSAFMDELPSFDQEFGDLFNLQGSGLIFDDIPPNAEGDLSQMNFELDSEALAWINVPEVC